MANTKVSLLVHDVSSNILWAATAMGRALQQSYDVQIIGPDLGGGICPMCRGEFEYEVVPAPRLYRLPDFLWQRERISRAVTGDVVIAFKAYADTVPVALAHKRSRGQKALVYLDEWDAANYFSLPLKQRLARWLRHAHHPLDDVYFPLVEKRIRQADAVLYASTFLQKKFDGQIVPLGVDPRVYTPQPEATVSELKRKLDLGRLPLVVFAGVVRPHKGVETLLDALALLEPPVTLLIVGPETECLHELMSERSPNSQVRCLGPVLHHEVPSYLALADLVVIPQTDTLLGRSQVPCKVFEAMAMAKPIIAAAVSDLPEILEGCGWTVPSGDPRSLAQAIRGVLDHPDEARARGAAAREKCLRLYTREKTGETLARIIEDVVQQRRASRHG